jgi:membrane protease YdiL (CAAX protease family)
MFVLNVLGRTITAILSPDNRLFELARRGGRPPSALTAIAVVLGTLVLVLIPGQMAARSVVRSFPADGSQSTAALIIGNVTMLLSICLALWIWLRLSSRRPFSTLGFERNHALPRLLRGAMIGGLMMMATAAVSSARGVSLGPGRLQEMGPAAIAAAFLSLLSYFAQGPAEEVLFRGWLLGAIGARYRPWIGVLVSSLVFSLAHGLSPGITALGFLNLFLFGVLAAVYALAEGGIWGIGAWHAVWNWTMGEFLGFASDGTPHVGFIRSIRADGPAILTGGAFGPEGGLACTAVFLLAISFIAARPQVLAHSASGSPGSARC